VYAPAGAAAFGPLAEPALGLKVKDGGCIVPGVPIGATAEACICSTQSSEFKDLTDTSLNSESFQRALATKQAGLELPVKHGALLLLSVCAAPSVSNLLRVQPPHITLLAGREADALLRTAFLRACSSSFPRYVRASFESASFTFR
jgi:hypothetical protein